MSLEFGDFPLKIGARSGFRRMEQHGAWPMKLKSTSLSVLLVITRRTILRMVTRGWFTDCTN
ncbi:hypothetical protein A8B77_10040 [Erythrobacter sp. EhN03]|nr:hypothetical protein A8B77_10040 [Erythrobacter sp. EhN03]